MRMLADAIERAKRARVSGEVWRTYRRRQLHDAYRRRRDRYDAAADRMDQRYSADVTRAEVQARLARRGYHPPARRVGEVHTLAFVPTFSWHAALLPDLVELGPVSHFDYFRELGISWEQLWKRDTEGLRLRDRLNKRFLDIAFEAHRRQPIDWVYVYASGLEITADTIRRLTDEIGVPTVNMCLDDKQSWEGPKFGSQRIGQIDIAGAFDLAWTSARVACEWYIVEGGRPLFLPEGFDVANYHPMDVGQDLQVSFVGAAYGFRPAVIRALRKANLAVTAFGEGWENPGVWRQQQVEVFNRSIVNLGFGGIGYSETLTNVKTRDFEIPGTGGGAYLTTFNPDLARFFEIGSEILCYQDLDELIELARQCLRDPEHVRAISGRARERCLAEHRWLHRYTDVCRTLGILTDDADGPTADRG